MADLLRRAPQCRTEPPAGYVWTPPPFNIVLPFCEKDRDQAVKVLSWQAELCAQQPNTLHLLTDEGVECADIVRIAQQSWQKVYLHRIQPIRGKWPAGNNHAFVEICKLMVQFGRPWLLLETDIVATCQDWLQRLEQEYAEAKRPFMGPWFEAYDLMNGGGSVYPPDTLAWIPNFLRKPAAEQPAFDVVISPEIIWFSHANNHLSQNIFFSRNNGRPGGVIGTTSPKWTKRMFEWVYNHHLCLLHRDKSGATIEFLREKFFDTASNQA